MAQGLDLNKPGFLEPLLSLPIRVNLTAIATFSAGVSAPPNPKEGQAWLDISSQTNIKLNLFLLGAWVTILQNLTSGPPTQSGTEKVVHTEAGASASWTIIHGLASKDVVCVFWNELDEGMTPDVFTTVDENTILATFIVPTSGRAIVVG